MEAALWHSWTNQQTTTSSRQEAPCMTFWFRRRLFPQTCPHWEISHPTAPTVPRGSKKNRERACNFRTANMRILPRAFTSKKHCGSPRLKQSRPTFLTHGNSRRGLVVAPLVAARRQHLVLKR